MTSGFLHTPPDKTHDGGPLAELVSLAQKDPFMVRSISHSDMLQAARAFLRHERNRAAELHESGAAGATVVRHLTEATDTLVRGLTQLGLALTPTRNQGLQRAAVCAVGGYGRGELSPCSDLDLCLIHEEPLEHSLPTLSEFLVPILFDCGLTVGFGVYHLQEAIALCSSDIKVFTSYVTARLLMGDTTTFARWRLSLGELRLARRNALLTRLRRSGANGEGTETSPDNARDLFDPQPDLKESPGGLRDYHAILWLLYVLEGTAQPEGLTTFGYLSQDEYVELWEGIDFLWRLRNDLHFASGRPENRLTFPRQREVARRLGYGEEPRAVERLMQDYYAAARRIRHAFLRVVRRGDAQEELALDQAPAQTPSPFIQREGALTLAVQDDRWFAENPARLMEAFWESARCGVPLTHSLVQRISTQIPGCVNDTFRENDLVRRYFLGIASRPLRAGKVFRQMAECGLLSAYLPEFQKIVGMVRYADFHSFPVDEHTLRAIEALAEIPSLTGSVGRILQRVLETLHAPHHLTLALLFHDLGKCSGEEHVEAGVRLVEQIAQRIGLSEEDTAAIKFLVQHHMVMITLAMYRDTDDPDVIRHFAELLKQEERLRALLLHSYADLSAVAPGVWTEWKGSLLTRLYLRTERFMTGRTLPMDDGVWLTQKIEAVKRIFPEPLPDAMLDTLHGFGERYFMTFTPRQIARHLEGLAEASTRGLTVFWTDDPDLNVSEVTLSTRDRHGLFYRIAGAFAACLVDVRGANLFTSRDGWVLDVFTVVDAHSRSRVHPGQRESVQKILRAVLLENEEIDSYVTRARSRLFALEKPVLPIPTRIAFDNQLSRTDTIMDVETGDRTGLLYDIARTLSDLGVDITSAYIVTDRRQVRDAFYLQRQGRKIEDPEALEEIRHALYQVLTTHALT